MTKESLIVTGKAFWSKLNKVDEMSNKFQIDVCSLSPDMQNKLKAHGVHIKHKDDDRGSFITARSKFEVAVIDAENHPMDRMTNIGNGSDVKVRVTFNKDHPMLADKGTAMYANKVKVVTLVEYEDGFDDDDWDDDEPSGREMNDEIPF
tara:strand:- start:1295 stop:1741 length:447 start_codon:yes stop_codon:yes gene_type:complete